MTDLTINEVGDTWVNGQANRRGQNYGTSQFVQAMAGGDPRRTFLRPALGNISGRTVLDAYLVGHAGVVTSASVTVAPVTSRWQVGRVNFDNQPTVNTAAQVTVAVPATPAGGVVTFPGLASIIQAVADGTPWLGLRLTTTSTSAISFVAADSGNPAWSLHVTLSDETDAATFLRPDGGAVSTATPTVAWSREDQLTRRVQVDTPAAGVAPDEVAPDYDSGVETSTSLEMSLMGRRTLVGAGPHFFRVLAVAEGDDTDPEWSDWAEFTVTAIPSLVIDSPVGPFGDPSPTVLAHLSSGTISSWKAWVTGPDRADIRAESGLSTGPISWNVPETSKGRAVVEDGGWIYVQASDSVDRAVTVGDPGYVYTWQQIVLADSTSVQPCANLMVSQVASGDPRHTWRTQRTEAPDALLFGQDDRILAKVELADLEQSGGFYSWTDSGQVQPLRPHALWVKAVEGSQVSAPVVRNQSHTVIGFWVIPEDPAIPAMVFDGTAVSGFANKSKSAIYAMLVGPDKEVMYDHDPGRVGAFGGSVDSRQDVWVVRDGMEALRVARNRRARFVWGAETLLGEYVDPDVVSADEILPSNETHNVVIGFRQVGP